MSEFKIIEDVATNQVIQDENEILLNHLIEHIKLSYKNQNSNYFEIDIDCNTLKASTVRTIGIHIMLPEAVADQQDYLKEFFSDHLKDVNDIVVVKCTL